MDLFAAAKNAAKKFMHGDYGSQLIAAARTNDITKVQLLVQVAPSKIDEAEPSTGWTALHFACQAGFDAVARELLQRGAEVNAQTKEDETALHLAVVGTTGHHQEIVKALLRKRPNLYVLDKAGKTALDRAREMGNEPMVKLLQPAMAANPPPPVPPTPPASTGVQRTGSGRTNSVPQVPAAAAPPQTSWQGATPPQQAPGQAPQPHTAWQGGATQHPPGQAPTHHNAWQGSSGQPPAGPSPQNAWQQPQGHAAPPHNAWQGGPTQHAQAQAPQPQNNAWQGGATQHGPGQGPPAHNTWQAPATPGVGAGAGPPTRPGANGPLGILMGNEMPHEPQAGASGLIAYPTIDAGIIVPPATADWFSRMPTAPTRPAAPAHHPPNAHVPHMSYDEQQQKPAGSAVTQASAYGYGLGYDDYLYPPAGEPQQPYPQLHAQPGHQQQQQQQQQQQPPAWEARPPPPGLWMAQAPAPIPSNALPTVTPPSPWMPGQPSPGFSPPPPGAEAPPGAWMSQQPGPAAPPAQPAGAWMSQPPRAGSLQHADAAAQPPGHPGQPAGGHPPGSAPAPADADEDDDDWEPKGPTDWGGEREAPDPPARPAAAEEDDWAPQPTTDWGGAPDNDPRPGSPPSPLQAHLQRLQLNPMVAAAGKLFNAIKGRQQGEPTAPPMAPPVLPEPPAVQALEPLYVQQMPPPGPGAAYGAPAAPRMEVADGRTASAGGHVPGHSMQNSMGRRYKLQELQAATHGFAEHNKIGSGGYGPVYRGHLDGTPVAIKLLDRSAQAMQGIKEFEREAMILSRLHHPNIVLLLGTCPEQCALVYELMEGGNLEDALLHPSAPPLPWAERVRITTEVAAALCFLHSAEEPIIHMDLKPANVLLDRSRVSKLADVGLARLIPATQQSVQDSRLVGTLSYMDPEYLRTGKFSTKSDIYSLGMVMLQLLTGRDASGLISMVEAGVANSTAIRAVIDRRAGPWPPSDALVFAKLALSMVEYQRVMRPDLRTQIAPQLRALLDRARLQSGPQSPRGGDREPLPMYVCPITQEVMQDPVFAADGYTYERAAIEAWLSHHDTSPMTNMALPNKAVTPNLLLRSSIREWQEKSRS